MKLRIVADPKISFVEEAFSQLGQLILVPGRKISRHDLKDADLLLVRSVTRVGKDLLEGTPVRMVATATTGTDHVDLEYLESRRIGFASAHGGGSTSVAEYVLAAILELAVQTKRRLGELSLGVVGVGNIGSIVVRMAEGLGMTVLKNDPPLAEQTGDKSFLPLDRILAADIVTLHVRLTKSGSHKTYHLFDSEVISRLASHATLINTSRGSVVDSLALKRALIDNRIYGAVLDVWENEPNIDVELMKKLHIGTSHIAGYSLDGKANCTALIYRSVCEFLGFSTTWRPADSLPEVKAKTVRLGEAEDSENELLLQLVRQIYDIRRDDADLRSLENLPVENLAASFDRLRDEYHIRREFRNTEVIVPDKKKALVPKIEALGFRVKARQ
jgi:erythronate-4-phosphate dehydrogenase